MKTMLITLFALFVGVLVPNEESWAAKRLGGGGSSGMQRNVTPSTPAKTAPGAATTGAAAQAGKRSWLGPIAGIAGAIGLAALFSSLGMGEEAANFMMILLLVVVGFVAVRWFLNRNKRPAERMSYAAAGPVGANVQHFESAPEGASANAPTQGAVPTQAAATAKPLPEGIDPAVFVRQAKLNFIRLQTANDTANLDDIREFTTPEMYAEIAMQIEERGREPQQTEVVTLNADILEFAEEGERQILSVRFHGLIREEDDEAAVSFDEAWHLVRPKDLSRHWLIAGIQQIA